MQINTDSALSVQKTDISQVHCQLVLSPHLSEHHCWATLQYETKTVRSPLTSPSRKQDFLLSSLSTDLYHHCTPHPEPCGPLGGYYPTKKKTYISRVLQTSFNPHLLWHIPDQTPGTSSKALLLDDICSLGSDLAQTEGLFINHQKGNILRPVWIH